MAFFFTIFFLFLSADFISGHLLFNHKRNQTKWSEEKHFKVEKPDRGEPFQCSNGFCKFLTNTEGQGEALILTPLLESGEIDKAKNLSAVDPGYFAGVKSNAAYFTVNKTNKWHLFFWYFPAQNVAVENAPLIIWLQGGPGSSSLFGLFEEIGPIQVKGGKVERKPITWGSNYSLLFIDNPVGSGFSFTENPDLYATDEDMVGQSLLNFLQQFLQVFSELRTAPLFIAGESYAGKYIPAFGRYIHANKNNSMPINLKGLAIGDGWTDPPTLMHYSEFGLQVGLLDPEQAATIHIMEENARNCWAKQNMTCFRMYASEAFYTLVTFAPVDSYNYLSASPEGLHELDSEKFLNMSNIQELLHVKKMKFNPINYVVYGNMYYNDMYSTVKPWLEELLEHYGVMCYSGQLDVLVAYALSVNTYQSLNWSGQQAYLNATRVPLLDENGSKINSFIKASGNFMDVMVRNAGHMVPIDQPRAAKQIIEMFIEKFK